MSLLDLPPRRNVDNTLIVKKNKKSAQQFEGVDTPPAFRRNVDTVSADTTGVRLKRSSDQTPEEKIAIKNMLPDITRKPMPNIDGMAMTKISRQAASSLQADSTGKAKALNSSESSPEPALESVMSWLLTHLPQLEEENAIQYFHSLINDGFDTEDALREILEKDVSFMEKHHQRELLQSLRSAKVEAKK